MSLIVNTNSEALIAQNNLNSTEGRLNTAITDLSSGYRINTAADDAAGYAISEDLTDQTNGLNQASNNVQDAVSLIQTANGAINTVEDMLQTIRTLTIEYNSGIYTGTDQNAIISEIAQLTSQIEQIGNQAQFNGITLFGPGGSSVNSQTTITFQVGANDGQTISVKISSFYDIVTGLNKLVGTSKDGNNGVLINGWQGQFTVSLGDVAGNNGAGAVLSLLSSFIDEAASIGAQLGAVQNRLSYTLDNLSTYSENLSSAQATIQDVDMASEMTEFTKEQILQQSGISMLSQAEQNPQAVLKLLGA